MTPYDPKDIEKKWQDKWEAEGVYRADDASDKKKFFALIEFPFPSGDGMHTGHLRSNTAMDIVSRKRRMEGYNVLYPIGWDAFGLPTENYAIKTGKQPALVTKENTDNFRRQLKSAGFSFDWSREINTTDPEYYRWTQWIFLKLYEKGLAYKKKMAINWCPKDKIGLANEEVIDGKCERCGTVTEKRDKEQWMLAITKYAERLDRDLDTVDFVDRVKVQQRNWIGMSEGSELEFKLSGRPETIKVFTTRADTLFGVSYVVLAPEHPLVATLKASVPNASEVDAYIAASKKKADIDRTGAKEKTGVELKGITAINPANNETVPVWIADYVLASYGTGAVMAVPAHDERDYGFAKKYSLPVKEVIIPVTGKQLPDAEYRKSIVAIVKNSKTGKFLSINWGAMGGNLFVGGGLNEGEDPIACAVREIAEETGYTDLKHIGTGSTIRHHYRAVSKNVNRMIDAIPLYFELAADAKQPTKHEADEAGKFTVTWLTVSEAKAKVTDALHALSFATLVEGKPYVGEGILKASGAFDGLPSAETITKITEAAGGRMVTTFKLRDWVFSRQRYWGEPIPMVNCASCGWVPVPESELPVTLPPVENYQPTDDGESPLSAITSWVNTTCPKCEGEAKRETDTMPNWAGSSWYFLRYADPKNDKALAGKDKLAKWTPVDWYNGGMEHTTLHLLYSRFWHKFLYDIGVVPTSEPYMKRTSHGFILAEDGEKMSKSRGNVVNPDKIIDAFGADTLRLYEMFAAPFEQQFAWSTDGIVGPRRFIERVWKIREKVSENAAYASGLESLLHKTVKKVTDDIETMGFNTAVSSLMILANAMEKAEAVPKAGYEMMLKALAPFAPHVAEELWSRLGNQGSIHLAKWPQSDPSKMSESEATVVVQVNGKVRGELRSTPETTEEEIKNMAMGLDEIRKWTDGKEVKKVIYVKGRVLNIVVA